MWNRKDSQSMSSQSSLTSKRLLLPRLLLHLKGLLDSCSVRHHVLMSQHRPLGVP